MYAMLMNCDLTHLDSFEISAASAHAYNSLLAKHVCSAHGNVTKLSTQSSPRCLTRLCLALLLLGTTFSSSWERRKRNRERSGHLDYNFRDYKLCWNTELSNISQF